MQQNMGNQSNTLKPDEGRLLTNEKINEAHAQGVYECMHLQKHKGSTPRIEGRRAIAKAQRDLTASIKDSECQERVERVKRGIEKIAESCPEEPIGKLSKSLVWQVFWEREGVK